MLSLDENDFSQSINDATLEQFTEILSLDEGKEQLISGFLNNPDSFITFLKKITAKELHELLIADKDKQLLKLRFEYDRNALHLVSFYNNRELRKWIPLLLEHGFDPKLVDVDKTAPLQELLRFPDSTHLQYAILMILKGADPNAYNSEGFTTLHKVCHQIPKDSQCLDYIPVLLKLGADPKLRQKDNKVLPIQLLMQNQQCPVNKQYLDSILALIQHSISPHSHPVFLEGKAIDVWGHENKNAKNILQIIYSQYPDIKAYVLKQGIPEDKLEVVNYVFSRIDIGALRLEIKYLSEIHQNRNNFLNALITLSNHWYSDKVPGSDFKKLPLDIIYLIASFMDVDAMNKSPEEANLLAKAVFSNHTQINEMTKLPGGVNVFQSTNKKEITFTLFKSAPTFCRDFDTVTKKMQGKAMTPEIEVKLKRFTKENAVKHWENHASLYNQPIQKLKLLESIEDSKLYQKDEIKSNLKSNNR